MTYFHIKLIWSLHEHIGHKGLKYESGCFNVTFSQRDIGCFCCVELHLNVCSLIWIFPNIVSLERSNPPAVIFIYSISVCVPEFFRVKAWNECYLHLLNMMRAHPPSPSGVCKYVGICGSELKGIFSLVLSLSCTQNDTCKHRGFPLCDKRYCVWCFCCSCFLKTLCYPKNNKLKQKGVGTM